MQLTTPAGNPALSNNSIKKVLAEGVCSEGLSIKVLPQAIAGMSIQRGTITGKLNGDIPTQTPRGCRKVQQSICLDTLAVNCPCNCDNNPP